MPGDCLPAFGFARARSRTRARAWQAGMVWEGSINGCGMSVRAAVLPEPPLALDAQRAKLLPRAGMGSWAAAQSLIIAAANGWLPWLVRASCKALQCDAWAAKELQRKARVAVAKARSRIRVMLKPDIAASLSLRCCSLELPPTYHALGYWVNMLHTSLEAYMAEARNACPSLPQHLSCEAKHCMALLAQVSISAPNIAAHALLPLLSIAGHLKLCEGRLQSIEEELGHGSSDEENVETCEMADDLLIEIDTFVCQVHDELDHFLP